MYVGRFLVAGPGVAGYRVSSRSFPNRTVTDRDDRLTVVPTAEAEPTDNPYVSYNCLRVPDGDAPRAVLGNGSHVDPATEKVARGYPARDALVESLHALDYEKDDYDTPRLAAVVAPDAAHVGIVRRDALVVRRVTEPHLVATYERDDPTPHALVAETAAEAAREVYTADFEHAVCAAGVRVADAVETAIHNE
ncbi:MAG: IMP cyclohydrolase [Halobaculum sp.]